LLKESLTIERPATMQMPRVFCFWAYKNVTSIRIPKCQHLRKLDTQFTWITFDQ
jgi:hypothetical protein